MFGKGMMSDKATTWVCHFLFIIQMLQCLKNLDIFGMDSFVKEPLLKNPILKKIVLA